MVSTKTGGSADSKASLKHGVGVGVGDSGSPSRAQSQRVPEYAARKPQLSGSKLASSGLTQTQKAKAASAEEENTKGMEREFKVKHIGLLGVLVWLL